MAELAQAGTGTGSDRRVLLAALFALAAMVWFEPSGSFLAEPDETRYAEIPREMLAAGDLVVPRLNGVPYFEKPPLLYWANAAAFRIFGETSWAARLPTRLAGMGTMLLVFAAAGGAGAGLGLPAAALFLAAPAGWLFSRTVLTDGLLTFFLTAALLAGRAAVLRRESSRPWIAMAALFGACAGLAFLSKGLIAIVLPAGIFFAWAVATGRLAAMLKTLVLSPAPIVFLLVALPWLLAAQRRHPGFLEFFLIREHFQRFATGAAKRPGPIYYFVPVLALGFLPGLLFFARGWWRGLAPRDPGFFFMVWFTVVFSFFSVSGSKLPPYLFPAIPAAAVLAALGMPARGGRGLWIAQAFLASALVATLLWHPQVRAAAKELRLQAFVAPAFALLVVASWLAVLLAARSSALALSSAAAGWICFFAAVAFGWPRIPQARVSTELAAAAREAATPWKAPIVGYKAYLNGVSWELKTPIPVADYKGELEPEFETRPEVGDALFWSREKFWKTWQGGRPVVALVRLKDLVEMMTAAPPARVVRYSSRYAVVANFPESP